MTDLRFGQRVLREMILREVDLRESVEKADPFGFVFSNYNYKY